jgi:hypothetical protein
MPSDTVIAAVIGGGVAAIVSGGFTIWNLFITRRSEERRQIRELAVKAAIENWSRDFEISKLKGGGTLLQPLDLYLVHAMHLVAALDGSLKTPEEIRAHLRQTYAITSEAKKEITDYNARKDNAV